MRLGLGLALLGLLATSCGRPASYPPTLAHALLDKPLPDFHRSRTLDGAAIDPEALAGHAVVVKFFAEYCAPCKRTLPAAEHAHESHLDVAFIGISEDEYEGTAMSLVRRFGLTFPVVKDQGQALFGRFRVETIPVTFVADKAGIVRWVGGAEQSEADLNAAIEAASR